MTKHLAIFKGGVEELILVGKKTIETRFSKTKIAPFGVVSCGDLVYMKTSGGEIVGQFIVQKVIFYDGTSPNDILYIKDTHGKEIMAGESYWKDKVNSRYGSLIFIREPFRFITSPIISNKKDLSGWKVLE